MRGGVTRAGLAMGSDAANRSAAGSAGAACLLCTSSMSSFTAVDSVLAISDTPSARSAREESSDGRRCFNRNQLTAGAMSESRSISITYAIPGVNPRKFVDEFVTIHLMYGKRMGHENAFVDLRRLADWFSSCSSLPQRTVSIERMVVRLGATCVPLLGRE